jgi:hypothetical protein
MTIVDGNALAGTLADVLGVDATTAPVRCSGCGSLRRLAFARVYRSAMGSVARCADCDAVLVTVVEDGDRRWVGMPGVGAIGLG